MFNLIANATRRSAMAAVTRPTHLPTSAGLFARAFSDDAAADAEAKMKGIVKWFDAKKGFGFIIPESPDQPEVFVHHSAIHAQGFRTLGEGENVEFELITEPNGKCKAINVTGPEGTFVQGNSRRMDYGGEGGYGGGGYGGGGSGGGYSDGGGY